MSGPTQAVAGTVWGFEAVPAPPSDTTASYPQVPAEAGTKTGCHGWMGRKSRTRQGTGPAMTTDTIDQDAWDTWAAVAQFAALFRTAMTADSLPEP